MSFSGSSADEIEQWMSANGYYLPGGVPTSSDLAPCGVFIALYALALPLLWWVMRRSMAHDPKKWWRTLLRPALFWLVRLALFIVRLLIIDEQISEGLIIADMILVLIGPIFLLNAAIGNWNTIVDPLFEGDNAERQVRRLARVVQVALMGAVIAGIVAGSLSSSAVDDESKRSSLQDARTACYVLSMIGAAALFLACLFALSRFRHRLPMLAYSLLFGGVCASVVVNAYRLASIEADDSAWVLSKAAFWVLQIAFEYISFVLLIASIGLGGNPSAQSQEHTYKMEQHV